MKRILAALMAAMLIVLPGKFASARAEAVPQLRWTTYESLAQNDDVPGQFHELKDTGVRIWIPDVFKSVEITGEYAESGLVGAFSLDGGAGFVQVALLEGGDQVTIQSLQADMREEGLLPTESELNGLEAVSCFIPDTDAYGLMVMYEPGRFLQFFFYPISNSGMSTLTSIMAASIQKEGLTPPPTRPPVEKEITSLRWKEVREKAAEVDPDGKLIQIGDLNLCLWVPSIFDAYRASEEKKGQVACFTTPDSEMTVAVTTVYGAGITMEMWQDALIKGGYTDAAVITVNGIQAVTYSDTANDTMNMICEMDGSMDVMQLTFSPASNKAFSTLSALMIASIQSFK